MQEKVLEHLLNIEKLFGPLGTLRLVNLLADDHVNNREIARRFKLEQYTAVFLRKNLNTCTQFVTDKLLQKKHAVILPIKRSA